MLGDVFMRECSDGAVLRGFAQSPGSRNRLTFWRFSAACHSHSIVNSEVPLIGKLRCARAPNPSDTDKSTVAFEDASCHALHAVLPPDC
jgi:hypothetical protein